MARDNRDAATFFYEELASAGIGDERFDTDDAASVIAALEEWRPDPQAIAAAVSQEVLRLEKRGAVCGEWLAGHLEIFIRMLPIAMAYKAKASNG
jgi:hypothetical protein